MNYITSCPACETQFLLTKEHLKAYKGKVQCGNCEHIFNAKNRLTEISDDIQSTAEYQASISEQAKPVNTEITTAEEKPIDAVLSNVLEGVPSLQDLTSTPVEADVSASDQFAYFDEPKIKSIPEAPETIAVYDAEQINTPIVIEDLTTDVRFSKPKIKINYWLVLLGILLAILAGLQTIYANRTQIAAQYPQFKPMLVQACTALQCDIALPKNLDLLTIDDSDMQEDEDHENVIKFSSLLINNASYAQAYPDIELTLTATDDQPVLRRLIKPNEYLKANTDLAAGFAAREEFRVNLAINVKDLAVAGYRVLLVY
jgi:predicted Zn finger-like uncharacterized protein